MMRSDPHTLLATSLSVLRECGDETLRALRDFARYRHSLGRTGIHRRDRSGGLPGRDLARPVCAADGTRDNADLAGPDAFAGICGAHDVPHVCSPGVVA